MKRDLKTKILEIDQMPFEKMLELKLEPPDNHYLLHGLIGDYFDGEFHRKKAVLLVANAKLSNLKKNIESCLRFSTETKKNGQILTKGV